MQVFNEFSKVPEIWFPFVAHPLQPSLSLCNKHGENKLLVMLNT